MYGDNREDLHNILLPIQKCVEWYWNERNADMVYMFNNAVLGLKFLKNSYSTYATIQHTLDYYIIILMQKNKAVMTRMGINTLDIERLTQSLLDSPATSDIAGAASNCNVPSSLENNTKSKHNSKIKDASKDTGKDTGKEPDKEIRKELTKEQSKEHASEKDLEKLKHLETESSPLENNPARQIQVRDIHKFLFELWNEREMTIVINLHREMETKQPGTEMNYIYNNIMQYCEMKENKLYKYIEQNSSIL
jgi:hypothetical protein